jgi:molybdopterin molybdotransferase
MMQEDCIIAVGEVRLQPGIRKGANRRHAGEDIAKGCIALSAGRRL